jgi:serine/threonine protein kinase
LQAIYTSLLVDTNPSFFLKITGENFYKVRQEPISPFYQMIKKIGEGSFGSVYKGKCLKTGEYRAIKILKKRIMN